MIKRNISGTSLRIFWGIGAAIAAMTIGAQSAHAGGTQATDSFNTPSEWSIWKSGGAAQVTVGSTSLARTPSNAAKLFWPSGGSTSNWATVGKTFFWNQTSTGGDHPAFTGCAAGIYLKNGASPAQGQIELIDTIRNTYVGVKTFSLSGNSGWKWVVVSNSFECTAWLTFRVVVPNTTSVQTVIADDLVVQWYW